MRYLVVHDRGLVRQVGEVEKAAESVIVHFFDAVNTIEEMEIGKDR